MWMGKIAWPDKKPVTTRNLRDPKVRAELQKQAQRAAREEQRKLLARGAGAPRVLGR